jgi:hypothetical protein
VLPGASTALNGSGGVANGGVLRGGGGAVTSLPVASAGQAIGQTNGAAPHLPPSMTKLPAPKVVGGSAAPRVAARPLDAGERPPFDPDGT